MNKKILNSLSGKNNEVPPIWLMRQAGRYLPEYREVRKNTKSFLDLCYTPEIAAEVTLQPIERFGFDASIIFSDILVIPHAMGVDLKYVEGKGPILEKIDEESKIDSLKTDKIKDNLSPVFDALRLVKSKLPEDKTLIGFAGAPWTIATYMVEGGGSKNFSEVKKFSAGNKKSFSKLIDILTDAISDHLINQIDAGAEVVQIFDSWAGVLSENDFTNWTINPTKKIVSKVKDKFPETPIIGFPKGAGINYEKFVKETGVDAVSIDYTIPLDWAAKNLQPHVCIQGNLDPFLLASEKEEMVLQVRRIIDVLGNGPFIFNLGHGILPHTPIENVELLLREVREKDSNSTIQSRRAG